MMNEAINVFNVICKTIMCINIIILAIMTRKQSLKDPCAVHGLLLDGW